MFFTLGCGLEENTHCVCGIWKPNGSHLICVLSVTQVGKGDGPMGGIVVCFPMACMQILLQGPSKQGGHRKCLCYVSVPWSGLELMCRAVLAMSTRWVGTCVAVKRRALCRALFSINQTAHLAQWGQHGTAHEVVHIIFSV